MDESTQKQINDYIKNVSDKEVKETIERSTELIRQKICTEVGLAIKENRTLITDKYIELVKNNIDIDKILTTEILNHLNRFILSLKTSPDEVIKKIMETQSSIGSDEELKKIVDENTESNVSDEKKQGGKKINKYTRKKK